MYLDDYVESARSARPPRVRMTSPSQRVSTVVVLGWKFMQVPDDESPAIGNGVRVYSQEIGARGYRCTLGWDCYLLRVGFAAMLLCATGSAVCIMDHFDATAGSASACRWSRPENGSSFAVSASCISAFQVVPHHIISRFRTCQQLAYLDDLCSPSKIEDLGHRCLTHFALVSIASAMAFHHPNNQDFQAIRLGHMPHQVFVCQDSDDWGGIINQKERRRLQNRLNQRAREWRTICIPLQNEYCSLTLRLRSSEKVMAGCNEG